MNRSLVNSTLSVLLIITVSFVYAVEPEENGEQKTQVVAAISQKVFKKMTEAQELIEEKKYEQGLIVMDSIRAKGDDLSNYEKAQMWNIYAYTYYLQEHYKESIDAYENLIALPDVPEGLITSSLNTLSQLYFTIEDYQRTIDTAKQFIQYVNRAPPEIFLLIGQAYYQLSQYENALEPIKQAINLNRENGKKAKESWLLLLRAIYFELNDYENMIATLIELIKISSKEENLRALAAAYSQTQDTKKQLAVLEALHEQGLVKSEKDILTLSNLYLIHEVPYKAAKLLEMGLNENLVNEKFSNLKLLAQAWNQAREDEKSLIPLKKAAELSNDGELFVRLGQAYINLGQWENSVKALHEALNKKSVIRVDTVNIMLGMALFNQKRFASARHAFKKAGKDLRSKHTAEQWIAYVESEQARAELIQLEDL